jgi:hypothetical protein
MLSDILDLSLIILDDDISLSVYPALYDFPLLGICHLLSIPLASDLMNDVLLLDLGDSSSIYVLTITLASSVIAVN